MVKGDRWSKDRNCPGWENNDLGVTKQARADSKVFRLGRASAT